MKAKDLADELLKNPSADVLLDVSNDWVEIHGIKATGEHQNAVTFEAICPGLGGVIVVEPDQSKYEIVRERLARILWETFEPTQIAFEDAPAAWRERAVEASDRIMKEVLAAADAIQRETTN